MDYSVLLGETILKDGYSLASDKQFFTDGKNWNWPTVY
jgi:hypothetical protein